MKPDMKPDMKPEDKLLARLEAKEKKDSSFLATLTVGCAGGLGAIVLIGLAWFYGIFAYGYVGSVMWVWFVMNLFPTAPAITWLQAAGLSLLVSFFTRDHLYKKIDPDQSTMDKVLTPIVPTVAPWITLLMGYIIHRMMM